MKNGKLLDLYSDYLISAFGQTSATGDHPHCSMAKSAMIGRNAGLQTRGKPLLICGGLPNHTFAKLKTKTV